jgi:hypothetical protein
MFMIPTAIIALWFSGLLSFALLGGGLYLAHVWYERSLVFDRDLARTVFNPDLGFNADTAWLARWSFLSGSSLVVF